VTRIVVDGKPGETDSRVRESGGEKDINERTGKVKGIQDYCRGGEGR